MKLKSKNWIRFKDNIGEYSKYCNFEVPFGNNEQDNVEVYKWGVIEKKTFTPRQHFEVPAARD